MDTNINKQPKREAIRERMTEMAILSEEAIKNGEVMTLDEAKKRTKDALKEVAASRSDEMRE